MKPSEGIDRARTLEQEARESLHGHVPYATRHRTSFRNLGKGNLDLAKVVSSGHETASR
jgi:hypothetical protein